MDLCVLDDCWHNRSISVRLQDSVRWRALYQVLEGDVIVMCACFILIPVSPQQRGRLARAAFVGVWSAGSAECAGGEGISVGVLRCGCDLCRVKDEHGCDNVGLTGGVPAAPVHF